jgi:hypothetical protein
MEEKRKFERFDTIVPTRIEIPDIEGQEKNLILKLKNLVAGGIFLKCQRRCENVINLAV